MTDDLEGLLSPRSVEDILAVRVRVQLGDREYVLPVLTIERDQEWKRSLDQSFSDAIAQIAAGDLSGIVRVLEEHHDRLLDALLAYDETGVLPPRDEIRRDARQMQVLRAVLGVRQSVSPLVVIGMMTGLAMMQLHIATGSLAPSSSPPMRTAGARARSAAR